MNKRQVNFYYVFALLAILFYIDFSVTSREGEQFTGGRPFLYLYTIVSALVWSPLTFGYTSLDNAVYYHSIKNGFLLSLPLVILYGIYIKTKIKPSYFSSLLFLCGWLSCCVISTVMYLYVYTNRSWDASPPQTKIIVITGIMPHTQKTSAFIVASPVNEMNKSWEIPISRTFEQNVAIGSVISIQTRQGHWNHEYLAYCCDLYNGPYPRTSH